MGPMRRDQPLSVAALGFVLAAFILVVGWSSQHAEVALGLAVVFLLFGVFGSMRSMGASRSHLRR